MKTSRLFSLVYDSALCLVGIAMAPKILYEKWRLGKYPDFFKKKLGKPFYAIEREAGPLVWIHAVSMGETKAIWKFADLLKKKYPSVKLLITSTTDTGHAEAKRSLPFANYHLYLPFDFSWIIRPIVAHVKPDLVILSESDHWFHFLEASKNAGASVAVINGKLSLRSQKRYSRLGSLLEIFFSPVDYYCIQNSLYESRLMELGIDSKKIAITGNLKFDAPIESMASDEQEALKTTLGIGKEDFVIVAGSTHETEEALLLDTFKQLLPKFPHMKLILVPRHPERFPKVEKLIAGMQFPYWKYSSGQPATGTERVLLIDTMGKLKQCYQLANLAFVCGSFVSHVGGHNLLEPSFYGVPVLFGPHVHTQTELAELLLSAKAGMQVSPNDLKSTWQKLLESEHDLSNLAQAGKTLSRTLQGTSERTLSVLEKHFDLSERFSLVEK